jgi:hypothetical protein
MYHWRVLPGAVPTPEEHADLESAVAYWDGSSAVRDRLRSVARSSTTVVLFLEHIPQTLDEWLAEQVSIGTEAVEAACAERNEFVRRCANGDEPANLPPVAAAIIGRYAPIAVVLNEFYWQLHGNSRTTPYPADDIQRVCAETGFEPGLPLSRT